MYTAPLSTTYSKSLCQVQSLQNSIGIKLKNSNFFIKDDYYIFDEKQYALVGQSTKNVLQLGDEIYVKVKTADLVKKQLDFYFLRQNNNEEL